MGAITSPLRIHASNPRYFADGSGRAIYLTGSHTWAVQQDIGTEGTPPFPWEEWLGLMKGWNHNFLRMWMFEQPEGACWTHTRMTFDPVPWARTGPGEALDGGPKFNLDVFNDAYFARLRRRVQRCAEEGIYVSVMLFEGWSVDRTPGAGIDPWPFHPFNGQNNVNGVDVPYVKADDDENPCLHSMKNPAVLAKQEAYVRHTIEALRDLPNVIYEIGNEGGALDWMDHMARYVKTHAPDRLVGITHRIWPRMRNEDLFNGPADWVSPAKEPLDFYGAGCHVMQDYQDDPPAADGRKVIVNDTDHLWGHGGNWKWVWKSFVRGMHPIFMDPWWPLYADSRPDKTPWTFVGGVSKDQPDYPDWEPVRRAMGDTLRLAERLDLARMMPMDRLASTRYCLADPGQTYVVYAPDGGRVTVDLNDAPDVPFSAEWFFPIRGKWFASPVTLQGGNYAATEVPFTGDGVLVLTRADG